jgi:(p)ppGpp synthase/HD superfamily hydrolase
MAEQIIDQIMPFAAQAHGSQQRKYTDELYIVHPVRVMEICRGYTSNITLLAAALLHDVLEDTEVTKAGITAFLNTVMNITDVTRQYQWL